MKKLWFKAKTFGWGWAPCSKEGWIVTIVYMGLILIFFALFAWLFGLFTDPSGSGIVSFLVYWLITEAILTAIFISIAYKTGEKPEWRWRNKK